MHKFSFGQCLKAEELYTRRSSLKFILISKQYSTFEEFNNVLQLWNRILELPVWAELGQRPVYVKTFPYPPNLWQCHSNSSFQDPQPIAPAPSVFPDNNQNLLVAYQAASNQTARSWSLLYIGCLISQKQFAHFWHPFCKSLFTFCVCAVRFLFYITAMKYLPGAKIW